LQGIFPKTIPVQRPLVTDQKIYNPNWLRGFTMGERCFLVEISKSSAYKTGLNIRLRFQVTQHIRDDGKFYLLLWMWLT
jgi:hypothetical protein